MNNTVEEDFAIRGDCKRTGVGVALLRAEIAFWRDMLGSADDSLPPEGKERMRYALVLAEYRLLQLTDARRRGDASTTGPPATSLANGKFLD